ncbi:MAG: hypothetical protein ACRERE_37745 [Candidatus Entotheonellia bacterium]
MFSRPYSYTRQVKRNDWPTLRKDHHPGDIGWFNIGASHQA